MVTDEGSVPEIAQYGPYYLPLNVFTASKGSSFYILLEEKTIIGKMLIVLIFSLKTYIVGSNKYPKCMFLIKNKNIKIGY